MSSIPKLLKARQFHSRIFAFLVALPLLVVHPRVWEGIWTPQLMFWGGYALVIIGAFGRVYCSAFIGGKKNDVVVREGPFSAVRNPLYVFSFLAVVGIGLQSSMVTLLVILVGAFVFYYPEVVAKEEAFLKHKFGDAYVAYTKEVPRWWPDFKRLYALWPHLWSESEQAINPRFIRRTAMDAAVFFIPAPCFIIIDIMQNHHILPVWAHLL